jgi:hypothetical protein
LLELEAVEYQSQKYFSTIKFHGNLSGKMNTEFFVGDEEVFDKEQIAILNNKMVMPPASQDMFVLFTNSIFNQLGEKLNNYFRQFN